MGILDMGASGTDRYLECRHCGHTVDDAAADCPTCGSDDIAEYQF
jgi:rubrerythrin